MAETSRRRDTGPHNGGRATRTTGTADVYDAVRAAANWLDEHNGADPTEILARILKVTEEAGEVAAAWIGATGQNPRKGVTHTWADVTKELADVAFTALVAIDSLGYDPAQVMANCAAKVAGRVDVADGRTP